MRRRDGDHQSALRPFLVQLHFPGTGDSRAADAVMTEPAHLTCTPPCIAACIPLCMPSSSLTMAAVLAPEAHRTEAGIGPPADRAGAAVLTGAGVTEAVLGVAA